MPTDPSPTVHLSPLEIWYMYKTKILTYAGIVAAALIFFGAYELHSYQQTTGSQSLYDKAETVADFQAVLKKYPGTVAAGNAALRLGDKLREEKKYDESEAVLRDFVAKNPGHPLASGGWTSLAATYEMQGNLEAALEANASAIAKFPDNYTTPIAMTAQARIYLMKGQKDDARRIYQDIMARFPRSLYARKSQQELLLMKK